MVDNAQSSSFFSLRMLGASQGIQKLERTYNLVKGNSHLEPIFSNKLNQIKNPDSPINQAFDGIDVNPKDGIVSKKELEDHYAKMTSIASEGNSAGGKSKSESAIKAAFAGWLKDQAGNDFDSVSVNTGKKDEMDLCEFLELNEKQQKKQAG